MRGRRLLIALAMGELLNACDDAASLWATPGCNGEIAVIGDWSPDERHDVERAVERFSAWTGAQLHIADSATCQAVLDEAPHGPARSEFRTRSGGQLVFDRVVLRTGLCAGRSQCRQALFLHVLGLVHGIERLPPGVRGVMAGSWASREDDFTEADREACLAADVCE